MANPEHLAILKQGVEVWNRWRDENRSLIPDLSAADLAERNLNFAHLDTTLLLRADLSRTELMYATLRGAKIGGANLRSSFLTGAEFRGADLSNCDLTAARLINADFRQTDLTNANFSWCHILRVEFTWAEIRHTKFNNAMLGWGVFGGTDLGSATGLESILHTSPSTIGVDSLALSQGRIPKVFFKVSAYQLRSSS